MKKYKGNKPIEEIKRAVLKNRWHWDETGYRRGGDFVTFGFRHNGEDRTVLYNTFSGRFLIRAENGRMITESSKEMDGTEWYAALLDFIYVPAEERKTA